MTDLWVDKYRPMKLDDYVFQNDNDRSRIEKWIEQGWTDNLLLVGPAGTGKTSLARIIINELNIGENDFMKLNASREGNVDTLRTDVLNFIQTGGWSSEYKYVVLNEADGMTPAAQPLLKDDMEENSGVVRWILTANRRHKIIQPLQDRCTVMEISQPDQEQLIDRMIYILTQEDVVIDDNAYDVIAEIVSDNYPSVRRCIRNLQNCVIDNKVILKPTLAADDGWKTEIINNFKDLKITEARDLIRASMSRDDIESYFIWMSNNLDLFENKIDALIKIRKGLVDNVLCADPEINLSGIIVEIIQEI